MHNNGSICLPDVFCCTEIVRVYLSMANPQKSPKRLIFSDLDGSLLDHYTYSFEPAKACLGMLETVNIPVVLVSSKTRKEIEALREVLGNTHPFIVEKGAAVFVPQAYFKRQPKDTRAVDEYWVKEFCEPRNHWLQLVNSMLPEKWFSAATCLYWVGLKSSVNPAYT